MKSTLLCFLVEEAMYIVLFCFFKCIAGLPLFFTQEDTENMSSGQYKGNR
jgi:hypothetical protein